MRRHGAYRVKAHTRENTNKMLKTIPDMQVYSSVFEMCKVDGGRLGFHQELESMTIKNRQIFTCYYGTKYSVAG